MQAHNANKGYSFFDLDFTLIGHDTMLLFANMVVRRYPWRVYYLLFAGIAAVGLVLGVIGNKSAKRLFFSFLFGMTGEQVDALAREFVQHEIMPRMWPEMLALLEEQRTKGDYLVLNTASPLFYAKYIAQALNFHRCEGTRLVIKDRMPLFPDIEGANNKGTEKLYAMIDTLPASVAEFLNGQKEFYRSIKRKEQVKHLISALNEKRIEPVPLSVGFSDSAADLPMLLICSDGVMVNEISPALHKIGNEKGWRTVTSKVKPVSKIGQLFCALGMYPLHKGSSVSSLLLMFALTFSISFAGCTNYSSSEFTVNPPIILDIQQEGNGHLVKVAAQNTEVGFQGYRLYEDISEQSVRRIDPVAGFACGPIAVNPNVAGELYIEVKPGQDKVTAGKTDRICAVPHALTSGTYIIFRSLIGTPIKVNAGMPSNAYRVP